MAALQASPSPPEIVFPAQFPCNAHAENTPPFRTVVFSCSSSAYEKLDAESQLAFTTNDSAQLPEGRLKQTMSNLVGPEIVLAGRLEKDSMPVKPRARNWKCKIDTTHIAESYPDRGTVFRYQVVRVNELAGIVSSADTVEFLQIDPTSLHMQDDHEAKAKHWTGVLDPVCCVLIRDIYDIGRGLRLISMAYWWIRQYVADIPPEILKSHLYDLPVPCMQQEDGNSNTIGGSLLIHTTSLKPALCISGLRNEAPGVALCGSHCSVLVRSGYGVSFEPPFVWTLMNPCLEVCHGFVTGIDLHGETPLVQVTLLMSSQNMPACLRWSKMLPDHLFQTNLSCQIPAQCILSSFRVLPFCLYHHGSVATSELRPLTHDAVLMGHLDISWNKAEEPSSAWPLLHQLHTAPGRIVAGKGVSELEQRWHRQHATEPGPWCVRVELHRTEPIVNESAFQTLYRSLELFGGIRPGQEVYINYLRNSMQRLALSKTKRATTSAADNSAILAMPGAVLMHLVYGHVLPKHRTAETIKGVLRVTVQQFEHVTDLLGDNLGTFDLTEHGAGYVQFFAPIVFKWEVYDTQRDLEDSRSPDGFSAVTFFAYEERDRHDSGVIKSTKGRNDAKRQLIARPTACK